MTITGIHPVAASAFRNPHLQMPACSLVYGRSTSNKKRLFRPGDEQQAYFYDGRTVREPCSLEEEQISAE